MRIDVWSDLACPWCAVGFGSLRAAIRAYAKPVEVYWHAFELDERAPPLIEGDYVEALATKYGKPREWAKEWTDQMIARGAEVGFDLDFGSLRPGNTFDAHRLLCLAHRHGLQTEFKERLLRAFFEEGIAIGRVEALRRLALEVRLPADEVEEVLSSHQFSGAVRSAEQMATRLGITSVPFFIIDVRVPVPGAQSPERLLKAILEADGTPGSKRSNQR